MVRSDQSVGDFCAPPWSRSDRGWSGRRDGTGCPAPIPSIRSARANAEPPVDRELLPLHVVTCNIVAWQAHESGCANTGSG